MTAVKLVKFKFKSESKQVWLDWSEELKKRKEEVVTTLKNEGVVSESCFMSEDGEFVYYFMEAEDFEKARNAVINNPHPIDTDHKKAREDSLEFIAHLDCLFHFDNRNN
jgi:L-rhamnose mutarotase